MSNIKLMREEAYREYIQAKAEMAKAMRRVHLFDQLMRLNDVHVKRKSKKRTISAEARHRMSTAAKKRWAARRKEAR